MSISFIVTLYTLTLQIIICGDININYLMERKKKNQLDNLLLSYNLTSIINFPMRIQNTYATAIDNIFNDISQFESYTTTPILNGLSDHDDQLLIISTDYSHKPIYKSKTVRKINKYMISDFNTLSNKLWDTTSNSDNVNVTFNSFQNIYSLIFYSSFPPNAWTQNWSWAESKEQACDT